MFLEIKNLTKSYNKKEVVRNVTFSLEKGKILCILGPSGCGKTTILNAIGGFIKIDKGKIILDGKDITYFSPEKRNIATVFQSYGLFRHKNVLENIEYGLKFKKISKKARKEKAMQIIQDVGLKGFEKREIHELSGGQRQRVALARSIVINPEIILMDEPFSNLDRNLRGSMRKELKNLVNNFNMTVILVTHDQEDVFSIADKVILMNEGKIEQNDSPVNLYNNPVNEFVLEFMGKSNKLNDRKYIRPEKIKIYEKSGKKAVIKEAVFKGALIEYIVETEERESFVLMEMNSGEIRKEGDVLYINYKESMY
ncbi:ABC transporter ATP-binding protein [Leptotrichia sp. OH3620_COT-345]|uniref:ABC transporter ATP-binding protein n=1 Tax=Leptotrichia sp. OH3620_COT-345 TaxID=2491048 RepID=UPI000F647813|nr:ABC transporter ATP-binding protein [Leptotrichia sp. OH3620_COT-345]RRD39595.1 ABC transporter ATP-binding protein [Leptotrichia sp. OH3620_COT-345]